MSQRKVHFSVPLYQIEYLDQQWETASRHARDGSSWLRMGIDRQRFRDRIERAAEVLNRILDNEFRQKIYSERFADYHREENQESSEKSISRDSQASFVSDEKSDCQLVNHNELFEHRGSPDHCHQHEQQHQQSQSGFKYTNRRSTKKKNYRRKKRGRGRAKRKS